MKEKPIYEQLGYDPDPPFYASTSIPIVTNYDRLISKTPEEMAEFHKNRGCPPIKVCPGTEQLRGIPINEVCQKCWLDWLKQEAQP